MLDIRQKLQVLVLGLMGIVAGFASYQTITKTTDGGTPEKDEPKPDASKEDMQISPPPLPLPVKIPNLLTQPEVVNDTSGNVETPPPLPAPVVEAQKTPEEVKKAVETEIRRIVLSKRAVKAVYTTNDVKKVSSKKDTKKLKNMPPPLPKNEVSNKKVREVFPGSWSQRRKELGYSAKDSITNNPKLLAEYNKWKASR